MVLQSWIEVGSARKYNYLSFACITYHLHALPIICTHYLSFPIITNHYLSFAITFGAFR